MPYRTPAQIPDRISEWFSQKGLAPAFDFHEVWRDEHQVGFTVAKMMELDLLSDMHDAMTEAIDAGQSLDDFVATQTERLQDLGWWGRQVMADPKTGEVREVQLGSPARLRMIYNTNLRTALAAGQWERIEATQQSHPYLLYQLGPSRVHRPVHVGWAGTLLRADDPWWRMRFPPNGWG